MEETLRAQLFDLADRFCAATSLSRQAIGLQAIRDNSFFTRRIANGRTFTIRTFDRVVEWFSANWPADVEWPPEIERPRSNEGINKFSDAISAPKEAAE